MAKDKKQGLDLDQFDATRPTAGGPVDLKAALAELPAAPAEGRIVPQGVGLRISELDQIKEIADSYDVSANSVLRYAVRLFIALHKAGLVDLNEIRKPTKTRHKLDMP